MKPKKEKWAAISVKPETRDTMLNTMKKTETYDDVIQKLYILKQKHETEYSEIDLNGQIRA